MKRIIFVACTVLAWIPFVIPAVPVATGVQSLNAPRIHVKEGASTNWSGYAVETSLKKPQNGVVSDVKGSWNVPLVTVPQGTSATAYSSIWVGIDGYSSSTVEQIGTDQDIAGGVATYYAWYEMYPKYPVNLPNPVKPGDSISAEVQYIGSSFRLTISDTTAKWTFSTTQKSGSARRSSAEWIVEAPWSGGVLPLADFGTANVTATSATLSGHTGSITNSNWVYDPITMVTSSGQTKALPNNLSSDGGSFKVTWYHN